MVPPSELWHGGYGISDHRMLVVVTTFRRELEANPVAREARQRIARGLNVKQDMIGVWPCRDKDLNFSPPVRGGYAYVCSVREDILPHFAKFCKQRYLVICESSCQLAEGVPDNVMNIVANLMAGGACPAR